MTVINPFDFFVDASAEQFPVRLHDGERARAGAVPRAGAADAAARRVDLQGARALPRQPISTIDFLIAVNHMVREDVNYLMRMEPGIQTPEETLRSRRARAATRRGCWCRSCATSASPRASPRATSSSSPPT
jgi:hypothetical protein